MIKDQDEHHTHQENSASQEIDCKEIDGLFDDAMVTLKQLKSPTRGRQASWEAVYRHLFPEASPIPGPCKAF
jgi:Zn/Cd-binding protein ZinT